MLILIRLNNFRSREGIAKLITCIMCRKIIDKGKLNFHLWGKYHFDKIECKIQFEYEMEELVNFKQLEYFLMVL